MGGIDGKERDSEETAQRSRGELLHKQNPAQRSRLMNICDQHTAANRRLLRSRIYLARSRVDKDRRFRKAVLKYYNLLMFFVSVSRIGDLID